jgi:hypothetical protein
MMDHIRGPWTIAVYTWREGMRKKTLIGFLILSILVIFGSSFMTAFMTQTTVGDAQTDIEAKLIKDICVTAISIFGVLITIFISASVVPNEVENKVVYTVLSKPVRRFEYLIGKFLGVQLIVIMNLVLMGALFFIALYLKQRIMPTLLLWSIFLTYFEFLIVSAFTFAVSCASTSSVLPTIAGLFIYITGNMTEYLNDVYVRAGQTGQWLDAMVGKAAYVLYQPAEFQPAQSDPVLAAERPSARRADSEPDCIRVGLRAGRLPHCLLGFPAQGAVALDEETLQYHFRLSPGCRLDVGSDPGLSHQASAPIGDVL